MLGLSRLAEEVALAFAVNTAVAPVPMIIGGKIVDKGYGKSLLMIGGDLFGLAFLIISFIPSLAVLYLAYGLIGGSGFHSRMPALWEMPPATFPTKEDRRRRWRRCKFSL